jgi:hypothetical protein
VADVPAAVRDVKVVGILPPEVQVVELTATGPDVLREDWSREAGGLLVRAAGAALEARGFRVRVIELPPEADGAARAEIDEARRLFRWVAADLNWLRRGRDPLPSRTPSRGVEASAAPYSVGDLSELARSCGVDAFVLVDARGEVSSAGRTAREVALMVLVNPFAIMAQQVYPGSWGWDRLDAAVVDRSGDLLWYGHYASQSTNLTDPADVARATEASLAMPPRGGGEPSATEPGGADGSRPAQAPAPPGGAP